MSSEDSVRVGGFALLWFPRTSLTQDAATGGHEQDVGHDLLELRTAVGIETLEFRSRISIDRNVRT